MKNKGHARVRYNPKAVGRPRRIGVERGFGPRHAANAKEGEPVDLTQIPTDTVDAKLTPREAVLNRNAAELAGRGAIEALNAEGNELAEKGVDLAAEGDEDVTPYPMRLPLEGAEAARADEQEYRDRMLEDLDERMRARGVPPLRWLREAKEMKGGKPLPSMQEFIPAVQKGTSDMKTKAKKIQGGAAQVPPQKNPMYNSIGGGVPQFGRLPAPPTQQPRGGFYPPGQGMFAGGTGDVQGPIGSPNPQQAYGPAVQLSAPDLAALLAKAGQSQGLSPQQIAGLTKAFQDFGGGGDSLSGAYGGGGTGALDAAGGFQGGISDIGYPPMIGPNMQYHADKGSTWTGPYDPAFLVERYARGTSAVPGYW